jgi:hypothetical protein
MNLKTKSENLLSIRGVFAVAGAVWYLAVLAALKKYVFLKEFFLAKLMAHLYMVVNVIFEKRNLFRPYQITSCHSLILSTNNLRTEKYKNFNPTILVKKPGQMFWLGNQKS